MLRHYAFAAVLLATSTAVPAQPGRYQIVVSAGNAAEERLLVDTMTGMSWFLVRSPCEGDRTKIAGCSINAWTSIPFHTMTGEGTAGSEVIPPPPDRALTVPASP